MTALPLSVYASAGLAASSGAPLEKPTVPDYIAKALADPAGRTAGDYMRDAMVGFSELYAFAQIKPGSKVIELYPGAGYNVEQISSIIGPAGHYYGITFLRDIDNAWELRDAQEKSKNGYELGQIDDGIEMEVTTQYKNLSFMWTAGNQFGGNIAVPEQVDVVFDDHYHDNHDLHTGSLDMVAVNKSLFRALKPGGVYMVMDVAAAPGRGIQDASRLHRTEPSAVIAEVTAAGFVLEAEDASWRRNDDVYTGKAQCYHCRDMSDVFAYRFRKPANAPGDMRPTPSQQVEIMKNYFGNTLVYDMGPRDIHPGSEQRHRFYNADGTFQDYGYVSRGRADHLHLGTWFWDASGHNCMKIEMPMRLRNLVTCTSYVTPREVNTIYEVEYSGGNAGPGTNPTPAAGDVKLGWSPLGTKGHIKLVRGHQFLDLPYSPSVPSTPPLPPKRTED